MKAELSEFFGAFGSEEETAVKIKEVYDKEGYVMDTTYQQSQQLHMTNTKQRQEMTRLQQ